MVIKTNRGYYLRWIRAINRHIAWITEYLVRMGQIAYKQNKTEIAELCELALSELYQLEFTINELLKYIQPRKKNNE